MSIRLQRELEKLKKKLLTLGALVEDNVQMAMEAMQTQNQDLAISVADRDAVIDQMEVDVEEECLKILALHQPVAVDLRFVIAVLKINNDLERVGDLAVNVANKVKHISDIPENSAIPIDFSHMAACAINMLRQSLNALVNMDSDAARSVCASDDQVDAMKRDTQKWVIKIIAESPRLMRGYLAVLGIARNLERIADLATNIAEDVIYMVEGSIVRHKPFTE